MHQHTWLHNETPYFLCNLKKKPSLSPFSNISLAIHVLYVHVHLSRTHMFTHMVTWCVFYHNSMQVLPGNWVLGGGGAHLLQLDIFHGNCILMWASQKRHEWHTDPMAEIILEQWPIKKQGEGGLRSCLLWYFSCQTEPRKKPLKIQDNATCAYFGVTQLLSPEVNGTWSGSTQHVRRVEDDITTNWRLSPQASESFIASSKVKWCLF